MCLWVCCCMKRNQSKANITLDRKLGEIWSFNCAIESSMLVYIWNNACSFVLSLVIFLENTSATFILDVVILCCYYCSFSLHLLHNLPSPRWRGNSTWQGSQITTWRIFLTSLGLQNWDTTITQFVTSFTVLFKFFPMLGG
jgi:hypothetical protein